MNCTDVVKSLGFRCKELRGGALRIWSPFTYGNDGQLVALYIEAVQHGYRVTDNAESLMHAASMGVNVSKSRLATIRRYATGEVTLTDRGEIQARATPENLANTVVDVLNMAMVIGHHELEWLPRSNSTAFAESVGRLLQESVGPRLRRNVVVTGASGHQIEIPFVVESGDERTYVQPVAYGDNRVEWDNVYRALGKMLDLKNAGADEVSRVIVVEDAVDDQELAKAITLMAISATVVYFSRMRQWTRRFVVGAARPGQS